MINSGEREGIPRFNGVSDILIRLLDPSPLSYRGKVRTRQD
jgi:hypothetical protein